MNPVACTDAIRVESTPESVVLIDERAGVAHELSALTAFVWRSADGSADLERIAERAGAELGEPVSVDDVFAAADQLSDAGLLQSRIAPAGSMDMGRRTWLRRIAVAGAAAAAGSVIGAGRAAAKDDGNDSDKHGSAELSSKESSTRSGLAGAQSAESGAKRAERSAVSAESFIGR